MDIEQLKLVLECVREMSGEARDFGLTYVLLSFLTPLVGQLITCIGCLIGVKMVVSISCKFFWETTASRAVRRQLGQEDVQFGHWFPSETKEVIDEIKKLQQKASDYDVLASDTQRAVRGNLTGS